MHDDEDVPFRMTFGEEAAWQQTGNGPQVRENVDTGAEVFDIRGMIAELESNPDARKRR